MDEQVLLINKVPLTRESSPKEILDTIAALREQKGKEKQILALIRKAIIFGHDYIIDLFWEEATVYQHEYMIELAKPEEERNAQKMQEALRGMEKAVKRAEFYITKYKLEHWESRLHRFWGRVFDYKGNFNESVLEYRKAIPLAKRDPDFIEKGYPRWLELEGFLAYSLIMSGKVDKGYLLAKKVCKKFDKSKEGVELKKKDYTTWAIWKTGVVIRTIEAVLKKKEENSSLMGEYIDWLAKAEKDLYPPKSVKTWADFKFRKDEVKTLKRTLLKN